MRIARYEAPRPSEQSHEPGIITAITKPDISASLRSAAALGQLCRGIITGEGPTASGRVHFSRTIDAEDTGLCARILIAAGQSGEPVSREEADALFEIHAAASEQRDNGRFDDLFAKAVVHHVMAASGFNVPRRELALDPGMPLDAWASFPGIAINRELKSWLEMRLYELTRESAATRVIARILFGKKTAPEFAVGNMFDRAA